MLDKTGIEIKRITKKLPKKCSNIASFTIHNTHNCLHTRENLSLTNQKNSYRIYHSWNNIDENNRQYKINKQIFMQNEGKIFSITHNYNYTKSFFKAENKHQQLNEQIYHFCKNNCLE